MKGRTENIDDFAEQFADYESLGGLYRSVYRGTDCGATLGAVIADKLGKRGEFYNNSLDPLGNFEDMKKRGEYVLSLSVSSIVEGVDYGTNQYTVYWNSLEYEPAILYNKFWVNIQRVETDAHNIWMDTHGCETCNKHFGLPDETPVWTRCPDCGGKGVAI